MDNTNIYERPYRPMGSMTADELKMELQQWRNLWTWVDPETQRWLSHVGTEIKVTRRNYGVVQGTLMTPRFKLESLEVHWVERIFNYSTGEACYETKSTILPLTGLVDYAFVHDKQMLFEGVDGYAEVKTSDPANVSGDDIPED